MTLRAVIAFLVISTSVKAQDTTLPLKAVVVEGMRDNRNTPFERELTDAYGAASKEGKRLSDALQEYAGIYLKNYGAGQTSSLSLAGSSAAQTAVLWNDVKVNSTVTGQADLSLFAAEGSRLLIAGPGSNGQIGGSLNLQDRPVDLPFESRTSVRAGSFGLFDVLSETRYRDKWFSGSSLLAFNTAKNDFTYPDPFREQSFIRQHHATSSVMTFKQSFDFRVPKNHQVGIRFWVTNSSREIPATATASSSSQFQTDAAYRFLSWYIGNWGNLKWKLLQAYFNESLHYTNASPQINSSIRTHTARHFAWVGYQHSRWQAEVKLHYNWEYAVSTGFEGGQSRHLYGLSAKGQFAITSQLKIQMSLAQEWNGNKVLPFSPSIQLNYSRSIKNSWQWQSALQFSRCYRLPGLNDLYWKEGGNPTLKPETSWQTGGWFCVEKKGAFRWDLQQYFSVVNDWILWHPDGSGLWRPDNLRQVWNATTQTSVYWRSNPAENTRKVLVQCWLNYAYTHAENKKPISVADQSAQKQLIYVPYHQANSSLQLNYYGCYVKGTGQFTGQRYITTDNTASLPAFALLHLEAGKTIYVGKQQLLLSFRVQNVLNTHYQWVAQYPTAGRSFEGTIQLHLSK
ncbi:MAG: hypothetical protein U0T84_00760 [Chitinophagales bacterium]